MKRLFNVFLIINLKSILIAALGVLSTWLCLHYELKADYPLTIIATAIIFPIVFSIGHAYKRRESALGHYGSIKAHGRAVYFAARDWLPEESPDRISEIEQILGHLLVSCRDMFKGKVSDLPKYEREVYRSFSSLSKFVKRMRGEGLPGGECSRCNQYISKMIVSFESIKHIHQYRTPRTLRAFSDFFIILLPILYGPYFANEAAGYNQYLVYVMPILFAIILVGLDNIQDHLEDPFDQIGQDDVTINAEKFVEMLSAGEGRVQKAIM
ncbi:MAG: hypothetical protein EX271_06555 [Acidimicrobiales bacterium]|nr:hypothetical protein [Hyphomonadaceae bacterium]RZV42141.1 MAG: hypothetical protein EX271_06555 [Acidimicrobiales bacterium]